MIELPTPEELGDVLTEFYRRVKDQEPPPNGPPEPFRIDVSTTTFRTSQPIAPPPQKRRRTPHQVNALVSLPTAYTIDTDGFGMTQNGPTIQLVWQAGLSVDVGQPASDAVFVRILQYPFWYVTHINGTTQTLGYSQNLGFNGTLFTPPTFPASTFVQLIAGSPPYTAQSGDLVTMIVPYQIQHSTDGSRATMITVGGTGWAVQTDPSIAPGFYNSHF